MQTTRLVTVNKQKVVMLFNPFYPALLKKEFRQVIDLNVCIYLFFPPFNMLKNNKIFEDKQQEKRSKVQ